MSAHTSGALKGSLGVTLPECPAEGEQGQLPIPGDRTGARCDCWGCWAVPQLGQHQELKNPPCKFLSKDTLNLGLSDSVP